MRIGPGVPCGLGTHVSELLAGCIQALTGGTTQVLEGALHVLAAATQLLVAGLQTSWGRTQLVATPTHGFARKVQDSHDQQSLFFRQVAPVKEQVPLVGVGQSEARRQDSPVYWHCETAGQSSSAVHPPCGVLPWLQVPVLDAGGQSLVWVQTVAEDREQRPLTGQAPPGLRQTAPLLEQFPAAGQFAFVVQVPAEREQVPVWAGQSEF